jgi:hypothetical protein
MTYVTSNLNEPSLDVSANVINRLKSFALENYNQAMKDGAMAAVSYWDGYIRACQHILEAEHE